MYASADEQDLEDGNGMQQMQHLRPGPVPGNGARATAKEPSPFPAPKNNFQHHFDGSGKFNGNGTKSRLALTPAPNVFLPQSYERPLERAFVACFLVLFPLIILVLVLFLPSEVGGESTTVGDFLNFTQFSVAHWLMPFCTAFWLSFLLCFCGHKARKTEEKRRLEQIAWLRKLKAKDDAHADDLKAQRDELLFDVEVKDEHFSSLGGVSAKMKVSKQQELHQQEQNMKDASEELQERIAEFEELEAAFKNLELAKLKMEEEYLETLEKTEEKLQKTEEDLQNSQELCETLQTEVAVLNEELAAGGEASALVDVDTEVAAVRDSGFLTKSPRSPGAGTMTNKLSVNADGEEGEAIELRKFKQEAEELRAATEEFQATNAQLSTENEELDASLQRLQAEAAELEAQLVAKETRLQDLIEERDGLKKALLENAGEHGGPPRRSPAAAFDPDQDSLNRTFAEHTVEPSLFNDIVDRSHDESLNRSPRAEDLLKIDQLEQQVRGLSAEIAELRQEAEEAAGAGENSTSAATSSSPYVARQYQRKITELLDDCERWRARAGVAETKLREERAKLEAEYSGKLEQLAVSNGLKLPPSRPGSPSSSRSKDPFALLEVDEKSSSSSFPVRGDEDDGETNQKSASTVDFLSHTYAREQLAQRERQVRDLGQQLTYAREELSAKVELLNRNEADYVAELNNLVQELEEARNKNNLEALKGAAGGVLGESNRNGEAEDGRVETEAGEATARKDDDKDGGGGGGERTAIANLRESVRQRTSQLRKAEETLHRQSEELVKLRLFVRSEGIKSKTEKGDTPGITMAPNPPMQINIVAAPAPEEFPGGSPPTGSSSARPSPSSPTPSRRGPPAALSPELLEVPRSARGGPFSARQYQSPRSPRYDYDRQQFQRMCDKLGMPQIAGSRPVSPAVSPSAGSASARGAPNKHAAGGLLQVRRPPEQVNSTPSPRRHDAQEDTTPPQPLLWYYYRRNNLMGATVHGPFLRVEMRQTKLLEEDFYSRDTMLRCGGGFGDSSFEAQGDRRASGNSDVIGIQQCWMPITSLFPDADAYEAAFESDDAVDRIAVKKWAEKKALEDAMEQAQAGAGAGETSLKGSEQEESNTESESVVQEQKDASAEQVTLLEKAFLEHREALQAAEQELLQERQNKVVTRGPLGGADIPQTEFASDARDHEIEVALAAKEAEIVRLRAEVATSRSQLQHATASKQSPAGQHSDNSTSEDEQASSLLSDTTSDDLNLSGLSQGAPPRDEVVHLLRQAEKRVHELLSSRRTQVESSDAAAVPVSGTMGGTAADDHDAAADEYVRKCALVRELVATLESKPALSTGTGSTGENGTGENAGT